MKNTVIVPISDLHSGGSTALFPDSIRWFKHGNHTPFDKQKRMFEHWISCAEEIRKHRAGKKLIIIHNGDAIDGNHHNTPQTTTILPNEQIDIHIELMKAFMSTAGYKDSQEEIYYVTGTEVHTDDWEDEIGRRLGATNNGPVNAWDELNINVNGAKIWTAHKGPTAGKGANQGNSLRNWLRDMHVECLGEGKTPPDFVIFSHVHKPYYTPYVGRVNGKYHLIHGMITPSWQSKTRFATQVAALQENKIGLQWFDVTKQGNIIPPSERLMR